VHDSSELGDLADENVMHYKRVLEEEFIESQRQIREKQKEEIRKGLDDIKGRLKRLLQENDVAEELERLERDDFVIDIATKEHILEEGRK
jgi:hypothetical protein